MLVGDTTIDKEWRRGEKVRRGLTLTLSAGMKGQKGIGDEKEPYQVSVEGFPLFCIQPIFTWLLKNRNHETPNFLKPRISSDSDPAQFPRPPAIASSYLVPSK